MLGELAAFVPEESGGTKFGGNKQIAPAIVVGVRPQGARDQPGVEGARGDFGSDIGKPAPVIAEKPALWRDRKFPRDDARTHKEVEVPVVVKIGGIGGAA